VPHEGGQRFALTSIPGEMMTAWLAEGLQDDAATIPAVRLLDLLPQHPILTLSHAVKLLGVTKPTAIKAITALQKAKVLRETTGRQRDRIYAYHDYLQVLTSDTEPIAE